MISNKDSQDFSLRDVYQLAWRCWPYYRPQLKHLILFVVCNSLFGLMMMAVWYVGFDLIENKILMGERLEPLQADMIFVGEDYVTTSDDNATPLTDPQRHRVRDSVLVVAVIIWLFVTGWLSAFQYYQAWIFQRINQQLRLKMLNQVERLSLKFHSHARTGDAMYRVYQDSATITNILSWAVLTPLRAVTTLVAYLVILLFFSPWFGLIAVAAAIPIGFLMGYMIPKVRTHARAARELNSDLTSQIQETLAAIRVIKANCAETEMMARFTRNSQQALEAAYQMRAFMLQLMLAVLLIAFSAFLIAEYFMATWALADKATFFGGGVAFVGFAIWNLGAYKSAANSGQDSAITIWEIVFLYSVLQDLAVGLKRAFYLLDLDPEVFDQQNPEKFPTNIRTLKFENVRFGYSPSNPVLHGINLEAKAGTVTAIVGGTGSGKSTLMSLLLRLYDPEAGRIIIDGCDVRDIEIDDLRSNIAIVLQQNPLFAMSVADNIRYSTEDASDTAVESAAKLACADEFIIRMPGGYATELGERGGKLSTGERQRLSIARALLRNTQILILDEPTASLDAETEQRVIRNLANWADDRIVFIITHRLSTIRNADQIAFLEGGLIKELGTHAELRARQGPYNRFVLAESGEGDGG
jgi:ATP-binding cassette subfamily B protein